MDWFFAKKEIINEPFLPLKISLTVEPFSQENYFSAIRLTFFFTTETCLSLSKTFLSLKDGF